MSNPLRLYRLLFFCRRCGSQSLATTCAAQHRADPRPSYPMPARPLPYPHQHVRFSAAAPLSRLHQHRAKYRGFFAHLSAYRTIAQHCLYPMGRANYSRRKYTISHRAPQLLPQWQYRPQTYVFSGFPLPCSASRLPQSLCCKTAHPAPHQAVNTDIHTAAPPQHRSARLLHTLRSLADCLQSHSQSLVSLQSVQQIPHGMMPAHLPQDSAAPATAVLRVTATHALRQNCASW